MVAADKVHRRHRHASPGSRIQASGQQFEVLELGGIVELVALAQSRRVRQRRVDDCEVGRPGAATGCHSFSNRLELPLLIFKSASDTGYISIR
jgi:hypothetical protein